MRPLIRDHQKITKVLISSRDTLLRNCAKRAGLSKIDIVSVPFVRCLHSTDCIILYIDAIVNSEYLQNREMCMRFEARKIKKTESKWYQRRTHAFNFTIDTKNVHMYLFKKKNDRYTNAHIYTYTLTQRFPCRIPCVLNIFLSDILFFRLFLIREI